MIVAWRPKGVTLGVVENRRNGFACWRVFGFEWRGLLWEVRVRDGLCQWFTCEHIEGCVGFWLKHF